MKFTSLITIIMSTAVLAGIVIASDAPDPDGGPCAHASEYHQPILFGYANLSSRTYCCSQISLSAECSQVLTTATRLCFSITQTTLSLSVKLATVQRAAASPMEAQVLMDSHAPFFSFFFGQISVLLG
ncbi:hypothetical protein K503DRAFT_609300 [Rhizopogon vinicolor AM-OR11-026]|uniref:Hydrophobin n=1 Tax=Rhizopogon vinicolor AM-OR11-026 TaxID=1314800 RepID=A0A1B7MIG7_9AGAM|nr:hypothetical protein K503DRAFT_609300 [Rhizopogon vinicolor AM-OR11-026]